MADLTRRSFVMLASGLVIVGLLAGSCNSPTSPKPGACGTNASTDTMSAKINGQDWSSIVTIGINLTAAGGGAVSITGNDGCNPSRVLTFNLAPDHGVATYSVPDPRDMFGNPIDTSGLTAVYYVGDGFWDAQDVLGKAKVTFTSLSATAAAGTFAFTLVPQKGSNSVGTQQITDGSFNVKFTVGQAGPLASIITNRPSTMTPHPRTPSGSFSR